VETVELQKLPADFMSAGVPLSGAAIINILFSFLLPLPSLWM
jgi:hypothetical protein